MDNMGGSGSRVNGAYYYYKIVANRSDFNGTSDTLNTENLVKPGYSRIDTASIVEINYPQNDSLLIKFNRVDLDVKNLVDVRYRLYRYSDQACTNLLDSTALTDTVAVIYAQAGTDTPKKGVPYWFRVRSEAYLTTNGRCCVLHFDTFF